MKIICEKSNLVMALQIVYKAIPAKTTMSILEYILIDATAQSIRLIGNDTEMGIETIVTGEIAERGYVAINARIFVDIVRKLPETTVTISLGDNYKVTIQAGKAKFNIIGRAGEEFNYLPSIEQIDGIQISQLTLKSIINQTIFAISNTGNEINQMMAGEMMEIKDGFIKLVALDGHRISIRRVETKEHYASKKVIIPGKTLTELSKILSDSAENMVDIYFTMKHVMFVFDNTVVISRLIEGNYFNIDQMLSSDYETKVTISRRELLESIDRSTLLIKEGDKKPVVLDIGDQTLELSVNTTLGSLSEAMEISKQGKDLLIGFNPRFLMDALRSIDTDEIEMYFVSPMAPLFIRDSQETYNYLILPINFSVVR